MKRINLIAFSAMILLITQSNIAFSQDYIPMNFEDGVWIEDYFEKEGHGERIQKECFGDTFINAQLYYKLFERKIVAYPPGYYPDTIDWAFTGLIGNIKDKTVQYIPYGSNDPVT